MEKFYNLVHFFADSPPSFQTEYGFLKMYVNYGEEYENTLNATDPDGDEITYFYRGDMENSPGFFFDEISKCDHAILF